MPPAPRIRPYKDFLTPTMHRKFMLATGALFGLCYLEAILIGEWNSFIWSWFPLGKAGIRSLLLFIPAFFIFMLRVSQLHVGLRTSYSGWDTFKTYAFRYATVQTIGWYFFSAYMFSEIYIWSCGQSADLNRIKLIPRTDRTTLNEKPIYLMSFLFLLSFYQAGVHLYYDYDRIDMPVTKTKPLAPSDQQSALIVPPLTQLKARLPYLTLISLQRAVLAAVVSPFLYSMDWFIVGGSIRSIAWSLNRTWARIFWTLPKSNALPSTRPFHWSVLVRSVTAGFLLIMLWEVGNAAFSAYVAQEPLKNDRPVTYESRDPNGSLLTGLNAKKLQTRAYAFWELVYISERFQGRRKTIYEDIDRVGGSCWSQILDACLGILNGVSTRIDNYERPAAASQNDKPAESIPTLPRLSEPLKNSLNAPGDLFTKPRKPSSTLPRVAQGIGAFAKDHGQSPPEAMSPRTKKLIEAAEKQTQAVISSPVGSLFKDYSMWLLSTQFGQAFRQQYRRRLAAVVLGTPYGDVGIIVDAIDSLTRLAVCSLAEDKYGNVQRDVKSIIQTFTALITKLEAFKRSVGVHWTDIEGVRESPEVDNILAALKGGLNDLVDAFEDYSEDLRLSQSEMRMAREAAVIPGAPQTPEMQQR